jgi:ABC-type transport system involved in multi-copper enzyme maturation permease subunit
MLTQTLAIFHDAYRELNAKKMFWIVLAISGLVVVAFAGIGITTAGDVTIFGMHTPFDAEGNPGDYYKSIFLAFGVSFWLSFIASALALISTASIFPDFISGGSIDLYLSKPLSRFRLFITKYAAGLLFVALQVFVFSLACFLVIGLRGSSWEPRIFLAVPLVVCFFSYLFAICAFFGVVTRSTLAAILLTVLACFIFFLVDRGEVTLLLFKTATENKQMATGKTLKVVNGQIASIEKQPAEFQKEREEQLTSLRSQRTELEREQSQNNPSTLAKWHRILLNAKTVLPKTRETTDLLERNLLSTDPLDRMADEDDHRNGRRRRNEPFQVEDIKQVGKEMKSRPVSWIIGTSLAFEAIVLLLAAWVFCRRDY